MKIAITTDPEVPVPPLLYGGIERIVSLIINAHTENGHEVHLFAHPDSSTPATLHAWKGKRSNSRTDTLKNSLQLTASYTKHRFDVIHSFSRLAYLTPLLPLNVKKVMSYQREPTISQVRKAAAIAKSGSLYFTGCSQYIANKIVPYAKARGIYNCIDTAFYQAGTTFHADDPLVFLGRIEPIKGTKEAIEVALKTGNKLIIAGNIPSEYQDYFDRHVKPYLNESITYAGPVNDDQKKELLKRAKAFLMPILWEEPFGIVMIEAMACGTPVIGFRRGAVPEVVEHGLTGYVCNDLNEMCEYVHRIHHINRQTTRAAAELRFSHKKIAAEYLDLYQGLLTKDQTI